MEQPKKHLIVVAGEASGDAHAAALVKEIKALNPTITFSGLGGTKMRDAGVELYEDLTRYAVVGFIEVITHLKEIKKAFHLILRKVTETRADAVILVDFPGFNMRLARELKKRNVKIIYYISPQVWAWKKNRIALIKRDTDKMLVLFAFEKELYERHGVDVAWVGHPLLDMIKVNTSRETFLRSAGLSSEKTTIGILPGSREKEVETLLPAMLGAARLLYKKNSGLQFLLIKASTVESAIFERHLAIADIPLKIIEQQNYDAINATDMCMVASGTATLETAILQKPMVVVYKTSFLTWLLAKLFIKIPYIGLVNVVAGKKVVPECIQFDATPEKIADELTNIIDDTSRRTQITAELAAVRSCLGEPGASKRAAREALKLI